MKISWFKNLKFPFFKSLPAIEAAKLEKAFRAFCEILRAVDDNPKHSQTEIETGGMVANLETSRNGDHHSICVFLPGVHSVSKMRFDKKYFVVQFDLDIARTGEEVFILLERHGTPLKISITNFEDALERACAHVRDWRIEEKRNTA